MNFVTYDNELIDCGRLSTLQMHELKQRVKKSGHKPTEPITGQQVTFVKPTIQDGHLIRRAHGRFESNTPIVELQDKFLFDPDIMVACIDDKPEEFEDFEPKSYHHRAHHKNFFGQSRTHYEGNIHIRDPEQSASNYEWILHAINHSFLIENGCTVRGEHRLNIPSRGGRYRIIDNAVLDSQGVVQVAIEYQCSPISDQCFNQRIDDYLMADIHQVWILGGKCQHNTQMKEVLTKQGINQFSWGFNAGSY